MAEVSQAARDDIRRVTAEFKQIKDTPDAEFGGHKGIALANLEGYLGRYPLGLLVALEEIEANLTAAQQENEQLRAERDKLREALGEITHELEAAERVPIADSGWHYVAARLDSALDVARRALVPNTASEGGEDDA